MWAGCLLQNQHVQSLLRHKLLEPIVLLLEFLNLFGHLRVHLPVLGSPAVVRLLTDPKLSAPLRHLLPFPSSTSA